MSRLGKGSVGFLSLCCAAGLRQQRIAIPFIKSVSYTSSFTALRIPCSTRVSVTTLCKKPQPYQAAFMSSRLVSLSSLWKESNEIIRDATIVEVVERKLRQALEPSFIEVTPSFDDPNGSHVSIRIVSEKFDNLPSVKRHQLVYKAIWEEMQGPIHAIDSLETKTPKEEETK
eukprot:jgi/Galph1/930/GphlegSOOS_G5724.1